MTPFDRRAFLIAAASCANASGTPVSRHHRVAIIGHTGRGNYGHDFDIAWNTVARATVVAVSDPDEKGRARAQARSGAKKSYADYREMLRVEKPSVVTIGPRTVDQRIEMVTAAAEAGAHILMEKPLAGSVPDADAIAKIAARHKIKIQLGHGARVSPLTATIQKMVADGAIGELVELRARGKEDKRSGGEELVVLGTHTFDQIRLFGGNPKWVFAHVTDKRQEMRREHVRQGSEPIGLVAGDSIEALFLLESGLHASFSSRANSHQKGDRFGITLCGAKGMIWRGAVRGGEAYILRSPNWRGSWEPIASGVKEPSATFNPVNNTLALDLLDSIEQDREPLCGIAEGRSTIEMVSGIYQSQRLGKPVTFPLEDRTDPLAAL